MTWFIKIIFEEKVPKVQTLVTKNYKYRKILIMLAYKNFSLLLLY